MENKDDLKKLFDEKRYVTAIVGAEGEMDIPSSGEDKIATIISLLTDPKNKDVKEEALVTLKKEKGADLLISAINSKKAKNNKHVLVAACWESEINFSKYLPFFVDLSLSDDYLVSLEAITVVENMEGPFNADELTASIKKVKEQQKNTSNERVVLLNDLVDTLTNFLSK
jgi:hypothetical protein